MNCPKCGKELATDEHFCENCGTPRPQEPAQPAPAPRPAPAPAKKSPVGLIVVLAVVIVAAVAVFLGKGCGSLASLGGSHGHARPCGECPCGKHPSR